MKKYTKDEIRKYIIDNETSYDSSGYSDSDPYGFWVHINADGDFVKNIYEDSLYNFFAESRYLTSLNAEEVDTLDWDEYFNSEDFEDVIDSLYDQVNA